MPYKGTEQDWDIELADYKRVSEFISYYKKNDLSDKLKYATMSIILVSYDDFLNFKELERDFKWYEIKEILKSEKEIFCDLIEYWAVDSEIQNLFKITPLIREVKELIR